ncbi:23S rRNA (uracil(1939)-C(5))-methyltransferase RlmD [Trinickia fusca]
MEARGVGRLVTEDGEPGKVIFVEGALPGERVTYSSYRKKPSFEQAQVVDVLRASAQRVTPQCAFFGTCGGCSMQHLEVRAQVAVKQRVLEDNLWHLAKLRPETVFRPIHGPSWGYRYRARLTVRHVAKKGGVLVGFHEKKSSYVADMTSCEVLPPHVSAMLVPLRRLVESLSIRDRLPQIEVAVGASVTALVLRVLEPLTADDEARVRAFADEHEGVQFWLQPKGPDTVVPFYPLDIELDYTLPEFNIRMPFKPTDFTQVNHAINRVLVGRAARLLAPARTDRVLDLFCGIGNFTLPLARLAREVMGIEGSETLTTRALANAKANGVDGHTSFACRNLFEVTADDLRALGAFDKYLIDPPREGALAVSKALAEIAQSGEGPLPSRIVYVSCNPATLARDAGLLVHEAGYRLKAAGVVNMFPHTSHVESIALFERD